MYTKKNIIGVHYAILISMGLWLQNQQNSGWPNRGDAILRQQGRQAHRSVNERETTLKHENQQKQRTKQNIIKANQNVAGIR